MTTMEGTTKEVFSIQTLLENQSLQEIVEFEEDQEINYVEEVEQILGYKFNDQTLLQAALTHSSYKGNCSSRDQGLPQPLCLSMGTYERLEYVGDAVLNLMMAREDYFSYPDLSPGMLTRLRAANVDTEKLARVAINRNLHKCLRHEKPLLQKQVTKQKPMSRLSALESLNVSQNLGLEKKTGKAAVIMRFVRNYDNSKFLRILLEPYFFRPGLITEFTEAILEYHLHSHGLVEAPKVLADIVESTIGAIFIDCGSCLQTTSKIVKNLLKPLITPETLGTHPMTKLYEICQKHGHKLRFDDLWEENGTIEVFVGDNFIAKCKYIPKRSIAWNRAANMAYNKIMKLNVENAVKTEAKSLPIDILNKR